MGSSRAGSKHLASAVTMVVFIAFGALLAFAPGSVCTIAWPAERFRR